jgi:ABC-type uncharacterized transport system involved in gliding motility auxiliary subunit
MRSEHRLRLGASVRQALLLVVQVASAATLFGLLLVLAERHNHRFDLTPTQSFVLAPESQRIAEHLKVGVRITAFYNSQEHEQVRQMKDLLDLFAQAAPNLTYRLLDLDRSPALAKKYGIGSFNTGIIELASGERRELKAIDEEEIVSALLRLTRRQRRTLCFIVGHGEHSPQDPGDRTGYSEVAKALERESFEIRTLNAIPPEGVPASCTVLLLPGPSQALLPGEAEQLAAYFNRGGQILLMVDPNAPPGLVQLLAGYGVRAGNDLVVDERNRFYGADSFMPRVPIFDKGVFGKNLDTAAVFALARTVSPMDNVPAGMKVLLLALSSPESWAYVDGGAVPEGTIHFRRDKDQPGPLPVAVMVIRTPPASTDSADVSASQKVGRMIVFGDSDFASNLYLNLLGNKDLFMSSIGVLAEDQELVAVRHKGLPRSSLSPVSLTAAQGRQIFWIAVIGLPAAWGSLGLAITWRRRRRTGA